MASPAKKAMHYTVPILWYSEKGKTTDTVKREWLPEEMGMNT